MTCWNGMMIEVHQAMNRTMGMVMLISGIFFGLCGVVHLTGADVSQLREALDLNTALFLGGGSTLFVVGILLMNDVHVAAPGSLMVRRGEVEA